MLKHPTLELLGQLGLAGMTHAFIELESNSDAANLSHAQWACSAPRSRGDLPQ